MKDHIISWPGPMAFGYFSPSLADNLYVNIDYYRYSIEIGSIEYKVPLTIAALRSR